MAIKKYYDSDCNLGVLDARPSLSSASAARATHTLRILPRAVSMSRRPAQGLCSLGEGF